MTSITFKNGLPLLLQPAPGSDAGLVAADSGCCCPPPPPDRCWCGDLCSYFIELVEPSELAVKTPTINCNIGFASDGKVISPSLLQAIVPVTDATANQSQSQVQSGGGLLLGGVTDFIQGYPDFLPPDVFVDTFFEAVNNADIRVSCTYDNETGLPKFSAQIAIGAEARFFGLGSGFLSGNIYSRGYVATIDISATCDVSPEKECVPSDQEFLRIDTPLEITVNGDGSSSLGSLGAAIEGIPILGDYDAAKDAVDAILAASSYTFRITARENCLPICPEGCDTNPAVTVSWETITIPDDCPSSPCGAWADNDGTYVRTLRTASGDGLIIPSGVGLEIIDDVCYLTGYVGTGKSLVNATAEEGECRYVGIIWKWKLAYPNCDVASAGPYTLTPEFYSGYQTIFTNGSETNSDIFSALGGCFSMSAPSVTLEFPP
jgi:hypothetical protein